MQFLISETLNSKVYTPRLEVEINESSINETLDRIDTEGDVISVVFLSRLSQESIAILNNIVASHNGESYPKEHHTQKVNIQNTPAFSSNKTEDGDLLYIKIHGMKTIIPANGNHEFLFTIPYDNALLQGAEIVVDILAQTDMKIKHPDIGTLEQYGYGVCTGKIIYKRQADYAAKLPKGFQVSATCFNTENIDREMGVNFILHEIREVTP
jgi:hypothetical protein